MGVSVLITPNNSTERCSVANDDIFNKFAPFKSEVLWDIGGTRKQKHMHAFCIRYISLHDLPKI